MENDTLDSIAMTTEPVKDLDGAGGILAMGIISIPLFGGFIGLILAILTLTKSGKALALYKEFPLQYTEKSYKRVKAGRVCAMVSLSLLAAAVLLLMVLGGFN